MDTREMKEIEAAVEGILFASGEPVGIDRICVALDLDKPFFAEVCNNCHFMHPQAAWEQPDKVEKLRMACAELEDERT
jgi:S-adenosylmethionine synthetase